MKRYAIRTALLIVVFIGWEAAATWSPGVSFFVSKPTRIVKFATANYQSLYAASFTTGCETVVGFVAAIGLSVLVMVLCLYWPPLLRGVLPIFVTSQILPIITLAPLFIVLFGMGLTSKIAMVMLMCFFPIFLNLYAGVKGVSRNVLELLYTYDASRAFTIFRILFPLSLPDLFVGLKVSTTMAVMGAIVAEFMGSKNGLGKNLYLAPKYSQPELMMCSIAIVMIFGLIFFKAITLLERYLCPWWKPEREESL